MSGSLFPSAEWIDVYCERVAAHRDAASTAAALGGVYRFTVDPGGPLADRHVYAVELRPDGDGGARAGRVNPDLEARLGMRAAYPAWRELIERRLDVGRAVLFRRLKVSGDLSGILSRGPAAQPLLDALTEVPTRWPE